MNPSPSDGGEDGKLVRPSHFLSLLSKNTGEGSEVIVTCVAGVREVVTSVQLCYMQWKLLLPHVFFVNMLLLLLLLVLTVTKLTKSAFQPGRTKSPC